MHRNLVTPLQYDEVVTTTCAGPVPTSATAATVSSLAAELDTDWAPDPWGWKDLPRHSVALDEEWKKDYLVQLKVPFLGLRSREVPIFGTYLRIAFHSAIVRLLADLDPQLSENVLAYRLRGGVFEHYRDASKRRAARYGQLKRQFPIVVEADFRTFFQSITLRKLHNQFQGHDGWHAAADVLARFDSRFGYAVPEGYAPARGLANFFLRAVDCQISSPYLRWVDDYDIFCNSESEGEAALRGLRLASEALGLQLSDAKTKLIMSSDETSKRNLSGLAKMEDRGDWQSSSNSDLDSVLQSIWTPEGERHLRYLLRLSAKQTNPSLLHKLAWADPASIPPATLPRLAWALQANEWSRHSDRLTENLLSVVDDFWQWRALRLAPVLWYAPKSSAVHLTRMVLSGPDPSPPLRAQLGRLLVRHAIGSPEDVLSDDTPSARRYAALAAAEQRRRSRFWRWGNRAAQEGPPVASYL